MGTASKTEAHSVGSLGQCLLYLMQREVGGPGVMNVPIIYRFRGPLDVPALAAAVSGLVRRHECLRTAFVWTESVAKLPECLEQFVHAPAPVEIEPVDMAGEPDPYAAARASIDDRLREDIDLAPGRPFTVDLFRLAPDDHLFMLNVHHIVTDAWSNMLLCRDLGELYNAGAGLEPVDWTFRDYVRWQQERLAGPVGAAHDAFWRRELERAQYPDLRPAPVRESGRMPPNDNVRFEISGSDIAALRALALRERTTLFVVMLALYFAVLHQASGQDDIAIGSVLANRPRRELFNTVGPFANLAVLSAQFPANPSFADVLAVVRRSVLEVLAHQEFPYLNTLTDPTMPTSSALRAAEVVFHMLALPNRVAPPSGIEFAGVSAQPLPIPRGMGSRFDLELLIIPQDGRYEGEYRYAPDRYERPFVDGLAERYTRLIRRVLDDAAAPLADGA